MLVNIDGGIYKISEANFKRFANANIGNYALFMAPKIEDFGGKYLGEAIHITDWHRQHYEGFLKAKSEGKY